MKARARRVSRVLGLAPQLVLGSAAPLAALRWQAGLVPELGPARYAGLLALLLVALVALVAAAARTTSKPLSGGRLLRLHLLHATTTWLVSLFLFPYALTPAILGVGAVLGAVLVSALQVLGSTPARGVELALTTLGVTIALTEAGLEVWSRVDPNPFLVGGNLAAGELIDVRRGEPGRFYFGTPFNSLGDHDEEPRKLGPGEHRVVSIGDSFSVGVVPHSMLYTTVCERELENVDVYNMGVGAISPTEYMRLLAYEAPRLSPDAIVVNLFVGNDLESPSTERRGESSLVSRLFDRENCILARFVVRTFRMSLEQSRSRDDGALAGRLGYRTQEPVTTREEAIARWPWLADPLQEPATYSEEGFMEITLHKAQVFYRADSEYPGVVDFCERMVEVAKGVPVLFTLIPDEPQVEDPLWEILEPQLDAPSRFRPQEVLLPEMRRRGLKVLDHLPAQRAVEPLADGWRHLYLRRDTHWNARGNEVAGHELARFLREELGY